MRLSELVMEIQGYSGVVRKREVSDVAAKLISGAGGSVLATHGEDAAAIRYGERVLLLAADGIVPSLMDADPL